MDSWGNKNQGLLAVLRTLIGFANLLIASLITLRVFEVI
tara:strand:- start:1648 stop:1764 length:117 start_codon:yes stop_codon:yes gene_type:complete